MSKTLKAGELTKMKETESRILWIEDLAGLVGGVQMNTLEFHIWGSDRYIPIFQSGWCSTSIPTRAWISTT